MNCSSETGLAKETLPLWMYCTSEWLGWPSDANIVAAVTRVSRDFQLEERMTSSRYQDFLAGTHPASTPFHVAHTREAPLPKM